MIVPITESASYFLIAFLILIIMSGGIVFMLCTVAACVAASFISTASVLAVASDGHVTHNSLRLKDGMSWRRSPPGWTLSRSNERPRQNLWRNSPRQQSKNCRSTHGSNQQPRSCDRQDRSK